MGVNEGDCITVWSLRIRTLTLVRLAHLATSKHCRSALFRERYMASVLTETLRIDIY